MQKMIPIIDTKDGSSKDKPMNKVIVSSLILFASVAIGADQLSSPNKVCPPLTNKESKNVFWSFKECLEYLKIDRPQEAPILAAVKVASVTRADLNCPNSKLHLEVRHVYKGELSAKEIDVDWNVQGFLRDLGPPPEGSEMLLPLSNGKEYSILFNACPIGTLPVRNKEVSGKKPMIISYWDKILIFKNEQKAWVQKLKGYDRSQCKNIAPNSDRISREVFEWSWLKIEGNIASVDSALVNLGESIFLRATNGKTIELTTDSGYLPALNSIDCDKDILEYSATGWEYDNPKTVDLRNGQIYSSPLGKEGSSIKWLKGNSMFVLSYDGGEMDEGCSRSSQGFVLYDCSQRSQVVPCKPVHTFDGFVFKSVSKIEKDKIILKADRGWDEEQLLTCTMDLSNFKCSGKKIRNLKVPPYCGEGTE